MTEPAPAFDHISRIDEPAPSSGPSVGVLFALSRGLVQCTTGDSVRLHNYILALPPPTGPPRPANEAHRVPRSRPLSARYRPEYRHSRAPLRLHGSDAPRHSPRRIRAHREKPRPRRSRL